MLESILLLYGREPGYFEEKDSEVREGLDKPPPRDTAAKKGFNDVRWNFSRCFA